MSRPGFDGDLDARMLSCRKHMPELGWLVGYPFALALMVATSVGLYLHFKRRTWI